MPQDWRLCHGEVTRHCVGEREKKSSASLATAKPVNHAQQSQIGSKHTASSACHVLLDLILSRRRQVRGALSLSAERSIALLLVARNWRVGSNENITEQIMCFLDYGFPLIDFSIVLRLLVDEQT